MDKKGTGWVPDFPDVKDYTLNSAEIQALAGQVQTERSMGAVEDLTKQVSQALKLLALKRGAAEIGGVDNDKASADSDRESLTRLERLIEQLDEKAAGGIRFTSVNILRSFTPGMSGPEILEIKQCLQKLYSDLPEINRNDYLLDPFFDELTAKLVEDFKLRRGLSVGSAVDLQTMDALRWSKSVQEDKDKYMENESTYPTSHHYRDYVDDDERQDISSLENDKIFNCLKHLKENSEELSSALDAADHAIAGNVERAQELSGKFKNLNPNQTDPIAFFQEILRQEIKEAALNLSEGIVNSRNAILEFLEENGVNLTPAVKKILDSSAQADDLPEKLIRSLLDEIVENETIDIASIGEEMYFVKNAVGNFISEAIYLPQYLLAPKRFSTFVEVEKSIQSITLDSLPTHIFSRIIPENCVERIEQLVKPVTLSEYQVEPYDSNYFSFFTRKRAEGVYRLREQFLVLGKDSNLKEVSTELKEKFLGLERNSNLQEVSTEEVNSVRSWVDESIEAFAQEHNISRPRHPNEIMQDEKIDWDTAVFEHHAERAAYHDAVASEVAIAVQKEIAQLLQPIVEVIVRLILPLGQHANYRKAADIGIITFKDLVADDSSASAAKAGDNNSPYLNNNPYLKRMALASVQKIRKQLESQHSPLVKKTIESIINQYEISEERLESELTSSKSAVTAPLLEAVAAQDKQADDFDLKIPVNWSLHKQIQAHYAKQPKGIKGQRKRFYLRLPEFVDLSLWCSDIEDQGSLNSCTAHAGVALTEYFAKRSFGKYTDVSPLFLYKTARNLMQRQGDSGASVRETMKAMVLFGLPPEEHWPYDEERYDEEPTPFCYSFAQNYQALKYFRLDYAGIAEDELLVQAKAVLAAGFPCMFGFTLYTSVYHEVNTKSGHIPYPDEVDQMEGGHAVVAVGYDDSYIVENADGKRSQGAILIRNSWGAEWGRGGYGWLPYDYVLAGLTADWWSLLKSEWFESGQFGVGSGNWSSNVGRPRSGHY